MSKLGAYEPPRCRTRRTTRNTPPSSPWLPSPRRGTRRRPRCTVPPGDSSWPTFLPLLLRKLRCFVPLRRLDPQILKSGIWRHSGRNIDVTIIWPFPQHKECDRARLNIHLFKGFLSSHCLPVQARCSEVHISLLSTSLASFMHTERPNVCSQLLGHDSCAPIRAIKIPGSISQRGGLQWVLIKSRGADGRICLFRVVCVVSFCISHFGEVLYHERRRFQNTII